jgi:hypothetical protein
MSELDRDMDTTRFDTEPLQFISREGLTCQEIEDYFTESIEEGKSHEDDDIFSTVSNVDIAKKVKSNKKVEPGNVNGSCGPAVEESHVKLSGDRSSVDRETTPIISAPPKKTVTISEVVHDHGKGVYESFQDFPCTDSSIDTQQKDSLSTALPESALPLTKDTVDVCDSDDTPVSEDDTNQNAEDRFDRMTRILARQYMWTSVAIASFVLGIGCLIMSRSVQQNNFHRRYSRR